MPLAPAVLLYQLLTLLIGFGGLATVAVLHLLQPSPLGRRFLWFSVPFAGFYLLVCLAAYVVQTPGLPVDDLEFWAGLAFFLLYAALVTPFTALVLELGQRPFRGPWRTAAWTLTGVGVGLALVFALVPGAPAAKTPGLRLTLQFGYLPAALVCLALLTWRLGGQSRRVTDPWKRGMARTLVAAVALGFPLFVADALWPWLQLSGGWVPRGLNFHGLFFAGLPVAVAYQWWRRVKGLRAPLPPAAPLDQARVSDLGLTDREREVLTQVFAGLTNTEIAGRLGLSVGTVKNHVYRIYQKSGASSRKEIFEMLRAETPPPR